MQERDPRKGPTPADDVPTQQSPGTDRKVKPEADHGESSYRGSGRLEGLAAVVTGGDSGIGRAVAIAFAREGADVAIGYVAEMEQADAETTLRHVHDAGRQGFAERFDVGDPEACKRFADRAAGEFGRLDLLVNNAAEHTAQDSVLDISPEQLERTFRTNVFGYFYMVQAVLPHLQAGAVIVQTGSVVALEGNPDIIDYSATKGAVHVFTKSLAKSLSERAIRVNTVAPGPVWTPLIASTYDQEQVSQFGTDTMWKRPAQPADLAPSYVFLASADARFISGEILACTGTATTR